MALKLNKRQTAAQTDGLDLRTDCTALYIRVSTEKQASEGYSLEDQRARLDAYCTANDWTVCPEHVYVDAGISGKTTDRPEFKRMLHAARNGDIVRVVALKLDRLARNTRQFLATVDELSGVGCDLVLVKESFDTSTPHGRFALTLFAAMAELERVQIAERTMGGRRQKARQGGYNGSRVAFGYTYDGEDFQIDETAAQTVRQVFSMFNSGSSLSAIAKELNRRGVKTQRGGKWYASTVRYILTNGFYAGLVQYDGISTDGDHDSIVDVETYDAAIARLQALKPGPAPASQ